MTSYSLGILGSWLLLALLALVSFAVAFVSYRVTIPPVSISKRATLFLLRCAGLFFLLFALFEPVLSLFSAKEIAPRIIAFFDNSQSTGLTVGATDRSVQTAMAINESDVLSLDDQVSPVEFSSTILKRENFKTDSLKFSGKETDISLALRWAKDNAETENMQAILFVTDGCYNAGLNPLYSCEELGKPIFVIGIGDTTAPRDVVVDAINMAEVTYVDAPISFTVSMKSFGYANQPILLEAFDNDTKIGEQSIPISVNTSLYSATFQFTAKQEGVHKISVRTKPLDGEFTGKNNQVTEFIRVLKNKRRIAIISGAPSADLSFLVQEFGRQKNVEVHSFVQKKGSEFYEPTPTTSDINSAEMIVLCEFPVSTTSPALINQVADAAKNGKPLLFIAGKQTDYSKLKTLEQVLPFSAGTSRSNEFSCFAEVKPNQSSHAIMRVRGDETDTDVWNQLPPIFRTETFVRPKPESEILASVKIGTTSLNEPLILTRSVQRERSVAILGYGLYRWRLMGVAADEARGKTQPDVLGTFLTNSSRFLTADANQKFVRVKTTKKVYQNGERVEFHAQILDAAYSPVDNATVSAKLSGKDGREITLTSLGGGRYSSSIDGLPQGDYTFEAKATIGGKTYGTDNGRFLVAEGTIEFSNLQMNLGLLQSMAMQTGGKFYFASEAKQFLNDLKKHPAFSAKSLTSKKEFLLWNSPYLLGLAILCFALEWFLRKQSGMV